MTTHEKTNQILMAFEQISQIPRCSKHEEKTGAWLEAWAREKEFDVQRDAVGNVLIRVPATPGYESAPIVVVQGHMDMVCEKTAGSLHNFDTDPIEFVYEGGWLKANQTTLGADNGMAIAMSMVLALDKQAQHPPLELLFTVDEETGLTGANALDASMIRGRILLNVDSEDEGVFTVGCAGGKDTRMALPLEYTNMPGHYAPFQLKAGGMAGGHSGVQIPEGRANAIKVLARALHQLLHEIDLRLTYIGGGTAHNAIPRDAGAILYLPVVEEEHARDLVRQIEKVIRAEYRHTDPGLFLTLESFDQVCDDRAMEEESTRRAIGFLLALPHGVAAMSNDMPGLVETSNNLANVKVEDGQMKVLTSQRSSVMSRLNAITHRIETIANLIGAEAHSSGGYPSWQPNMDSPLLARCLQTYRDLFGREPKVEAIHAGLECGIIGAKAPGMDMISFGPTLKNPHSPDEKVEIESIGMVWDFMLELLKSFR